SQKLGWEFQDEGGQKFVIIRGQKVRYYPYPPEKYNIEVRQMILRNTAAELEMLLDPRDNIGGNLSMKELRRIHEALQGELEKIPPYSGEKPEYKERYHALCRTICCVDFRMGVQLVESALAQAKEGKPLEEVLPTIRE